MVMFREIHKNTWLKRLTAEGKKITIGPKKSEKSWVVFCVHDDTEALLEGYLDPRHAPSHSPEWIISMQNTLHISHALIPNSHEFEFVVTLSNEVVRFHAMSWDIMQEWVETLRSKLREMKILSPRENLYTKLPEIKPPLLPTRDPTSPLPAPPPVPAAIVPGVERVISPSVQTQSTEINESRTNSSGEIVQSLEDNNFEVTADLSVTTISTSCATTTSLFTSMSNTLTQNLLNMLSDPISAYSEQIHDATSISSTETPEVIPMCLSNTGKLSNNNDVSTTENITMEPVLRNNFDMNETIVSTNNLDNRELLAGHRFSADQIQNLEGALHGGKCHILRPQSSRSLSVGAADKSTHRGNKLFHQKQDIDESSEKLLTNVKGPNITELEVNQTNVENRQCSPLPTTISDTSSNITIIQVSTAAENSIPSYDESNEIVLKDIKSQSQFHTPLKNTTAEIFTFSPSDHESMPPSSNLNNNNLMMSMQHEYKSNVQIIPSSKHNGKSNICNSGNNSYTTVQIMREVPTNQKITKVRVSGNEQIARINCVEPTLNCVSSFPTTSFTTSTPKVSKKIILSANSSCITNITINSVNDNVKYNRSNPDEANVKTASKIMSTSKVSKVNPSGHYEMAFLTTSSSTAAIAMPEVAKKCDASSSRPENSMSNERNGGPLSPLPSYVRMANKDKTTISMNQSDSNVNMCREVLPKHTNNKYNESGSHVNVMLSQLQQHQQHTTIQNRLNSPAAERRRVGSPSITRSARNIFQDVHNGAPSFQLKRGNTEAVIISRPSRRDFPLINKVIAGKKKSVTSGQHSNLTANGYQSTIQQIITNTTNNNNEDTGPSSSSSPGHTITNRSVDETLERRKRSSSTSDANIEQQRYVRMTNNNELSLRASPQSLPIMENVPNNTTSNCGASSTVNAAPTIIHSPSIGKRMSLREQQIMQLRREIIHPGGVRLQLRRKDCVGSIAWVDAFGAVWVAGWKQKEHPVLYNALHIGDQLLSIAGMAINSAAEANKFIRSTGTLFVEVLVRRVPMGRGYAIRREKEGQCLGLIRDGNTATIVDVIPNSLAARHGLPPKAQSYDGTGLTCWMLTEINGRPLNLFFKDNEIRDRLNSVGRDISILVQPSDLITKLKKQLKSLRSYKDYLVQ